MVNQSKVNDPRFWQKWKASGAVSALVGYAPVDNAYVNTCPDRKDWALPNMTIFDEESIRKLPNDVVKRLHQIGEGLQHPVRVSNYIAGYVLGYRASYKEVSVFDSGRLLEHVLMGPDYVVCLTPGGDYTSLDEIAKFELAVGLNIPERPEGYAAVPMEINGQPLVHIASLGWGRGRINVESEPMGPYMGLKR